MLGICGFTRWFLCSSIEQIGLFFAAGAFHLIHMMFDEYVFLVMETQHDQVTDKTLQKAVQKYMKCAGMHPENMFSIIRQTWFLYYYKMFQYISCSKFLLCKTCNCSYNIGSSTMIRRIILLQYMYWYHLEEIKTQAKVRVPSSKHLVSPKGRKRKIEEEVFDSNGKSMFKN